MALTFPSDILRLIYSVLVNDPQLQARMGTVTIYVNQAPDQPELPYIVHRLREGESGPEPPIVEAVYYVSSYVYGANSRAASDIANLIQEILGNRILSDANVRSLQMYRVSGEWMPTGNARIWRYDSAFQIRYAR